MKKLLIILCAGLAAAAVLIADASAQDYKSLRTNTWSIYRQGGVSWADGLDFQNVNESSGTSIAPEVGGGVNYNIRPWIRLGLNYEFSKYKREQRFDSFQPVAPQFDGTSLGITELEKNTGGIVYRNLRSMYHNVDFTVEFNIMQLWKNRKSGRFNLYLGSGFGMMFASGNNYSIGMGYEKWVDPDNFKNGLQVSDNWASRTWVEAVNSNRDFDLNYVPANLSAEYDVSPRLTLGLKGQYKFLLNTKSTDPERLGAAAFVVRYNFVGRKQGYRTYRQRFEEISNQYGQLQDRNNAYANEADRMKNDLSASQARANQLARDLEAERARERSVVNNYNLASDLAIWFEIGKSNLSEKERINIGYIAEAIKRGPSDKVYSIFGSADKQTGSPVLNQRLSEQRAQAVYDALVGHGVNASQLRMNPVGDTRAEFDKPLLNRVAIIQGSR